MATNLELKVKCSASELERIADLATSAGSTWLPPMRQVDRYFHVPAGRLKLREIAIADAMPSFELIGYHRPHNTGARWSSYTRALLDPEQGAAVQTALSETLGVQAVVEKRRHVAIWRRTRIHFDTVTGLGSFVELETATESDDDPTASDELDSIAETLGLRAFPAIAGSYADLIEETID